MMKLLKYVIAVTLLSAAAQFAAAQGNVLQTMTIAGQTSNYCAVTLPGAGPREEIAGSSATLRRTPNGITASVSMPTPLPGSYCYPPLAIYNDPSAGPAMIGHPEAWSLWGIYFNNPEACPDTGCSAADVLGPNCVNAQAGAVQLGGHIVGGRVLHISGHLSKGDGPIEGLGCAPLKDVEGAEIHLAVAPHGMLLPDYMPTLVGLPPGGGPGYWFPATFEAVD